MQTPAIRERMVSGLLNVAPELAQAVAKGLGMPRPAAPMPKVLPEDVTPEVTASPALSLFARPGTAASARGASPSSSPTAATASPSRPWPSGWPRGRGAAVRRPALGAVEAASGEPLDVDASIETTPSCSTTRSAIPDGEAAVKTLLAAGPALEFLKDQYRHCKPILAAGAAAASCAPRASPTTLPDGHPDPGLLPSAGEAIVDAFLSALAKHRHFERETDPPRV